MPVHVPARWVGLSSCGTSHCSQRYATCACAGDSLPRLHSRDMTLQCTCSIPLGSSNTQASCMGAALSIMAGFWTVTEALACELVCVWSTESCEADRSACWLSKAAGRLTSCELAVRLPRNTLAPTSAAYVHVRLKPSGHSTVHSAAYDEVKQAWQRFVL